MTSDGILLVSKAHFNQVVLRKSNSSLNNAVGAVFVADPEDGGFYELCASLGRLLMSLVAHNWHLEEAQAAMDDAASILQQVKERHRFTAEETEQLLGLAAVNLDFCVDVDLSGEPHSEMVITDGQRALMELQGKLRQRGDALREALLARL